MVDDGVGRKCIDRFVAYKTKTQGKHKGSGRIFWQTRKVKGSSQTRVHGQPCGKDWFYKATKPVALWLGYNDNWQKFTFHCIRKTGATFLANSGATLMQLKNFGSWKSDGVAQHYVDNSKWNKSILSHMIASLVVFFFSDYFLLAFAGGSQVVEPKPNVVDLNPSETNAQETSEENGGPPPAKKRRLNDDMEQLFGGCKLDNCTINVSFA